MKDFQSECIEKNAPLEFRELWEPLRTFRVHLSAGEMIFCESGAMVVMDERLSLTLFGSPL